MSAGEWCWTLRGLLNRADSALYDARQQRIELAQQVDDLTEKLEQNHGLRVVLQMAITQVNQLIEERGPDADLSHSEREALGLNLDALYLT